MKKILLFFAAIFACTLSTFAYDFEVDSIYYNFLGGDSVEVTYNHRYTFGGEEYNYGGHYSKHITIPEKVLYNSITYRVTALGYMAFRDSGISTITIPNSVTSIGNMAFYYCSSLTEVTIPNSVTTIGYEVFYFCKGLTAITIPNSVTSIGNGAFRYCSNLTEITIPNSVISIGNEAFSSCSALEKVNYLGTIDSWCNISFGSHKYCDSEYCESYGYNPLHCGADFYLNDVKVTELTFDFTPNDYFRGCTSLETISFTENVSSITSLAACGKPIYSAFQGCKNLKNVTLSSSITTIPASTFENCSSLQTINSSQSITTIESNAFKNCTSLQTIEFASVTSLAANAFVGCTNLKTINLPALPAITENAFENCIGLETITIPSATTIGTAAFKSCSSLQTLNCSSVKEIGNDAFQYCTSLASITLPKTISTIGGYAFFACTALSEVTIKTPTPPTGNGSIPTSAKIIVPCGSTDTYLASTDWANYSSYEEAFILDWSVVSADETQGTVSITKSPSTCDDITVTFEAIPASGYKFKEWNDGNTDNHRTVEITDNITYTAYFLNENNVDGISLDVRQLNLYTDSTHQLTATITPTSAVNKNVTWSSYYPEVASVDANGLVTAHSSGTTTITVTTEDGGFTAYCEVHVTTPITSLAFKQSYITLEVGDLDYLNTIVIPVNADRGTWYWYSSNESVVSVADGLVTAHRIGTATITLNAIDYMLSATCEIAVVDEIVNAEDSIVVDPADNSVTITWSAVEGAAYYILVIYADEAQTEKICTLTFDAHGRLINLNFQRNKPAATHEDNLLNFTVTGLQPNTTYGYSMNSYNEEETIITSKAGQFTTTSDTATGVETLSMLNSK